MLTNEITEMFTTTIGKEAEQLAVFIATEDSEIKELESQLKERKARLEEAKTQLAELMFQAGQESIKFANGLTPKAKIQVKFFKAAGVDDDQLFDWLNANGMGDVIKLTVHFQTLQSSLRQYTDQGGQVPAELLTEQRTPTVVMYGKSKFINSAETRTA